jgi:tRNA nucleotidyltransferase/poly(A) polymerase
VRGVRFATRFGLRWEPQTLRACREALSAGALGWLNTGRLRKELDRMRQEPSPRACLDAFADLLAGAGPAR